MAKIETASSIMGRNFLGIEEVEKAFGAGWTLATAGLSTTATALASVPSGILLRLES